MAEATAIAAVVSAAATLAGAGVAAYSQHQAGQAAYKVGKHNAAVAEQQAQMARDQAKLREETQRRQDMQVLASQRAAIARSGVSLDEGTSLLLMDESVREAERNAQIIRYEGELDSYQLLARADLERFSGRQARRGANIAAGSSLLSGAASAAGTVSRNWPRFNASRVSTSSIMTA